MDSLLDVPPAIANGLSVLGMLSVLFYMLATGRLVTRREHENRVSDKDQTIATQAKTIEVKDRQLEQLAVVGETVIKVLASVDNLARRGEKP